MSLKSYLTQQIYYHRPSGSNISGSWESIYATSSVFYGVMEDISGNEIYFADKKENIKRFRLFTLINTLQETDLIQVDGVKYEIENINNFNLGQNVHTEVDLILRK